MYPTYPSASYLAGLGSEEMIPPIRGLDSFVFSASDTLMSDADSILGKRPAEQQEEESEDQSRAVVLHGGAISEGIQKKGRMDVLWEDGNRKVEMEATSHGAAGQLTGPHGAARQGQ
jgi:hypothetical protein